MLRTDMLGRVAALSCALALVPDVFSQATPAADLATVPADEGLESLTNSDWSSVQLAYAASRHADTVVQQDYLKASNTDAFDNFGASLAVSGDTVVIGAPAEDSSADGVNGDGTDNSEMGSGAAYVFVRGESGWSQQAYLKGSNSESDDGFGWSLSLSGETLVVGARHEDSAASGVDGDQTDNSLEDSGAAYVFVRNGSTWSQQAYLKASNAGLEDQFGFAVAVSDDTLVVGAQLERSAATGVNGDQNDDSFKNAGAVYVFVRTGTTWSQQAYVKASNTDPEDEFGRALDLSGDTLVVGSRYEDSSATGINGDQGNQEFGSGAGAAYVFVRKGASWSQQAYLKAFNTVKEDYFGDSVAVSGDTVVVGAFGGDGEFGYLAGTAYVFARTGVTWVQQAYLTAANIESGDKFGWSVAVSGDVAAVGALLEDSDATGVDGDGGNNLAPDSGAAYVFVRSGASWAQQAYVKASNSEPGDQFGGVVAVSGTTVLVGSSHEDSRATGVNGDQSGNLAEDAGAAYSFDISAITPDPWADMGCALPGTLGDPVLVGTGSLSPESSNAIDLSNTTPGALAALFLATASTPITWKGGILKPFPFFTPIFLITSPSGAISVPFVMPPGVPADTELWVQWGIQDGGAVNGVALSTAIKGVTP